MITAGDGVAPWPRRLTPKQRSRRARVIEAALELGRGGYDAVQIRDVAARADVALGTVYYYFSSKDHLLAEAMAAQATALGEHVDLRPLEGTTHVDRLRDFYNRACHALAAEPALTSALVTALASPDPGVARSVEVVAERVRHVVHAILEGHYEPDVCDDIASVLGHVWYSCLLSWAVGRRDLDELSEELEMAISVLCR